MINLSDVYRNSSFDQWFSVFFKIVQKSVKSQGIFQLLMRSNPVYCTLLPVPESICSIDPQEKAGTSYIFEVAVTKMNMRN